MLIYNFVVLFICLFSSVSADKFPKYRMIDLRMADTDESHAIAVNEEGQVLGIAHDGDNRYPFIWDVFNGHKAIELPAGTMYWGLKLNGRGQIAGIYVADNIFKLFFWDPHSRLLELDTSLTGHLRISSFNDKGQILGSIDGQAFLWDHGKKTNLTLLFHEKITGSWSSIYATAMNNHGHIAFSAYQSCYRSFLWMDDCFNTILPESLSEISIVVDYLDDLGNMIVSTFPPKRGCFASYFIDSSKNVFAACQGCESIRNALPVAKGCLPGQLKWDDLDKPYFSRGFQIKDLIEEQGSYYSISSSINIHDQNSKGYVVGTIGKDNLGSHAFMAIPETWPKKK